MPIQNPLCRGVPFICVAYAVPYTTLRSCGPSATKKGELMQELMLDYAS